jgi:hypothetical protein
MINLYKEYKTRDGKPVRGLKMDRQDERAMVGKERRRTGRTLQVVTGEVFMMDDLFERKAWCGVVWDDEGREIFGKTDLDLIEASKIKVETKQTLLFT